jgi:hypothetical protein
LFALEVFFCTIWCQVLWFCANVSCVHCFVEYQNSVPTCRNKCTGAQLTLWLFISGILHTILSRWTKQGENLAKQLNKVVF